MQPQQKCVVWKNRKFPVSAETQLSSAATHIKCSARELALTLSTFVHARL